MIRRLISSQLRRNMLSGLIGQGVGFCTTAVAYPVYLHFLGYEHYGIWLMLGSVLSLAQLGNLGIGPAVARLVAESWGRKDKEGICRYMSTAIAGLAVNGTLALTIIVLFREQIVAVYRLQPGHAALALRLLPYIGVLSLYVFIVRATAGALSGMGRIDLVTYSGAGARILSVGVAAAMLSAGYGVVSLLVAYFVSEFIVHAFTLVLIRRIIGPGTFRLQHLSLACLKRLMHFGSGLVGSSILNMALDPFNKLIISRYAGVGAMPVYDIGFRAAMYLRGVLVGGCGALMPEISRLSVGLHEGVARIRRIYRRTLSIVVGVGIPASAAVFIGADLLLKLWLRQRFTVLLPPVFRVMIVGSLISATGVPAYYAVMGLGRSGRIFMSHLLQSCTTAGILLGAAAWPGMFSVKAAAVAAALGMGCSTVYLLWAFHVDLKRIAVAGVVADPVRRS